MLFIRKLRELLQWPQRRKQKDIVPLLLKKARQRAAEEAALRKTR
jgi:hypothetical protein